MNVESSFSQIAPLVFDGESYDLWKVKMKSYTESFDLWNDVEEDYEVSLLPENQEGKGKYMPICWCFSDDLYQDHNSRFTQKNLRLFKGRV